MLNYANLTKDLGSVQKPLYNPRSVTAGIVHFGVGNFFRAHQAYYLDRLLKDDPYWGVIGVGLRDSASAREKSDLFRKQNGIYSLTECASDGSFKTRLIGVLLHYILAPQSPQAVLKALISPETHLVSMTLTEGGYPYDARAQKVIEDDAALNADLKNLEKPQTAFGYIVAGCALRRKLKGCGFTVLSCDNLQQNGTTTKKIVLYLARAHDPDLAKWIEENVTFPNAMVDRITPSITAETQRLLNEKTGLNDALPVLTEDFTQWVIEDNFLHTRPEFEKVGAQIVGDVSPYEHVKTRMLNASHGMLCYSACLLGYEIKDEALRAEPLLRRLLWDFWNDDVIPTLTPPKGFL
ncbi:mannitol dehydrogenase family protein [Aristophania vespae]|uniref:mannitol dehydrogenase family protein n=1 Tax=Aristophania vespae TaxID=2697033 RepID=UPI002110B591|nr:mannitol dehydrogenase family protein [Aristophania vespae]